MKLKAAITFLAVIGLAAGISQELPPTESSVVRGHSLDAAVDIVTRVGGTIIDELGIIESVVA